jgi:coproporphyrinogen III oxidase-like Fe-S oxidoreductase
MKCLIQELTSLIRFSGIKTVTSLYFGGGTPSLAEPRVVETIVATIRDNLEMTSGTEVTLEANPTSAQTEKLRAFKMAGVTRLSVGVQSFSDTDLKLMNRDHSVAESECCLSEAHQLFPGQVNVDMIFGRPHQTVSDWKKEIKRVYDYGL